MVSRMAATLWVLELLHGPLEIEAHAAAAEETDDRGGAEGDVPGVDGEAYERHPNLRQDGVVKDLQRARADRAQGLDRAHIDRLDLVGEQLAGKADAEHGQRQHPGERAGSSARLPTPNQMSTGLR